MMNIAVIFLFSMIITLLRVVFGIDLIAASGQSYTGLLIYSAIFGFVGSFFSLSISRWSAKKAYGIVPFTSEDISRLSGKEKLVYDTVEDIASRNNITIPEVGIYNSMDPNAFATGPSKNKSLVAVSSGLLHHMNEREVEGVVAHEMAHILNGDMVTMTLLQGVLNTFVIFFARILAQAVDNATDGKMGYLGYMGVYIGLQLLLGIFASMVLMAFSRYREYRADEGSSRYVGKEKMIAALESLKNVQNMAPKSSEKFAAMQISTKPASGFAMLFRSHPSLESRIKNLEDYRV